MGTQGIEAPSVRGRKEVSLPIREGYEEGI